MKAIDLWLIFEEDVLAAVIIDDSWSHCTRLQLQLCTVDVQNHVGLLCCLSGHILSQTVDETMRIPISLAA